MLDIIKLILFSNVDRDEDKTLNTEGKPMEFRELLDQSLEKMTEEQKTDFIRQVCLIMHNRNNSDLIVRAKIKEIIQRFGVYE